MASLSVLKKVESRQLKKAAEGFVDGAYCVTVTEQTKAEIRGFVTNGDGKKYGVMFTEAKAFCSCRDAMFWRSVCKHSVTLALHAIRIPQAEAVIEARGEEAQSVNLKLA